MLAGVALFPDVVDAAVEDDDALGDLIGRHAVRDAEVGDEAVAIGKRRRSRSHTYGSPLMVTVPGTR